MEGGTDRRISTDQNLNYGKPSFPNQPSFPHVIKSQQTHQ